MKTFYEQLDCCHSCLEETEEVIAVDCLETSTVVHGISESLSTESGVDSPGTSDSPTQSERSQTPESPSTDSGSALSYSSREM